MPEPTRPVRPATPGVSGTPTSRAGAAVIGVLVVVAITVAALLARPDLAGSTSAAPAATGAGTATAVAATGATTEVTVQVEGMSFSPSRIEVPAGDRLVITLDNTGDQRHDLVLADGAETGPVAPGDQAVLDAGIITAGTEGWCSLPGHRQMGMVLQIVVVDGATDAAGEHAGMDHAGTDAGEADVVTPTMAALQTAAEAADALPAELPALDDSTEHHYTFRVTEQVEEVAEGVTRTVWTYNGTSPGPVLHGRVGDTFHITLVNDGTMGHSIDFHAGEVAPDAVMRTIEPGEQLEYTFTASRSGIWMYHCSTMPMSSHIANGMFGAVVIEPDGLAEVDRSYVLVQSEQYLGAEGGTADATKVAGLVPDLVTFNGRAFQYDAHPLEARVGERVRIWVLDAGPNAALSFHVVGTQFDTVWSEGAYTVHRGVSTDGVTAGTTGAQTLSLLAAEGGFVELVASEPGSYALVNHQMSLAEKGAHGVLRVTAP